MTTPARSPGGTRDDAPVDDIGPTFVPRPAETVVPILLDGELVLVAADSGAVYTLDPVGAIVWRCFDGEVDLATLAGELADAFAVARPVVAEQLTALCKELGARGLLCGVRSRAASTAHAMAVGDALASFTLPDLDCTATTIPDGSSARTLLVNWSPSCGFCAGIASELADQQQALLAKDTALVLVASGDISSNVALLETSGLRCTTLLRNEQANYSDPFRSLGTPVALLVDADGRVSAPPAFGAEQVRSLARFAAGASNASSPGAGAQYLSVGSEGMCGAGPKAKRSRTWSRTTAYQIGPYHIGLRSDSERATELVERLLSTFAVTDSRTPTNYSLVLGDPTELDSADLRLLLAGSQTVMRTRSPRRALETLVAHLDSHVPVARRGLARTHNLALVRGTEALLLPPMGQTLRMQLLPHLARRDISVVDAPFASIDLGSGALVVDRPDLAVDITVLDEVADSALGRSEPPPAAPGHYPLKAWWVLPVTDDGDDLSPAQAVAAMLTTVDSGSEAFAGYVSRLKGLLGRVLVEPMIGGKAASIADAIVTRLSGADARRTSRLSGL
jgi:hypothetical protein